MTVMKPSHLCCDICAKDSVWANSNVKMTQKSLTLLISKAAEPTPANAKVKKLDGPLKECQYDLRQEFQDSNLHFLYSRICIL